MILMAVTAAAGQGFALLGLWLRLRSRFHYEHAHGRLLVDVATAVPCGVRVDERCADGSRLVVTVEAGTERKSDDDR
ncbi:hypothetical protein [Frankia sp. AvcI1]|uniref:hypothetical protein n=1 Tax=Frankia sp. AvcI1 TaxID=573496 RepID=UPI0007C80931|nr:hypothetical protein [Frankia sp. AvcI1]